MQYVTELSWKNLPLTLTEGGSSLLFLWWKIGLGLTPGVN